MRGFEPASPEPAQIGKAIEIAENFEVNRWSNFDELGNLEFGASANRPGHIKRSGGRISSRGRPPVVANFVVLLEIIDLGRQGIDVGFGDQLKSCGGVAVAVIGKDSEFAHEEDEFFLNGEDGIGDQWLGQGCAGDSEGGVEFIHGPVGRDPWMGFGDSPTIH